MNHKYSTIALILLILLIPIVSVVSYLASDEIDEGICSTNNRTLVRIGGVWQCSNFTVYENTTDVIIDTGGRQWCIGNCSS